MVNCTKCGSELPLGASFCPKCGAPVAQPPPAQPKLAFWGTRFVAWLIDYVIVTAIFWLFRVLILVSTPGYVWPTGLPGWFSAPDYGANGVVLFLYWTLSEGIYSQSFGKLIMRIRISRLDGTVPNMGQAAIESIGKAFLLPIDVIVGWFLYLSHRQRLFNYLSNTIVVRADR